MPASRRRIALPVYLAVLTSVAALTACGGGNSDPATTAAIPAPPADPGFVDNAPIMARSAAT
ncbi:hypothetical protein AB4Y42_30800 [Paraburkholderia sp. EG286B]|uniref:hypothetical protein n=1 Tax=Paraburkholderia sp. EG286B TaxID=3237011 RepID=UPI0034D384D8